MGLLFFGAVLAIAGIALFVVTLFTNSTRTLVAGSVCALGFLVLLTIYLLSA